MADPRKGNLHKETVKKLREFADELKGEGLISDWDKEQIRVEIQGWEPFRVNPDLALHVPNRGKVLVEIVNPEKPKRYLGEILYAHIMGSLRLIGAAIFFILPSPKSRKSQRAMVEEILLHRFLKKTLSTIPIFLDTSNLGEMYRIFRFSIVDYRRMGKFY